MMSGMLLDGSVTMYQGREFLAFNTFPSSTEREIIFKGIKVS